MAKKAKKRASKSRAPAKESTTAQAKPSDVMKVPSEPKLRQLLRATTNADSDRMEATGRKGSLIAKAVENDHLDRKAWSIACWLNKASTEKGSVTWAHLQHYVEALGLRERFDAQLEMFPQAEEGEEEPEAEAKAANGSFAGKVQAQQEQRTTSLANPKHQPSPEQVKEIADRAGASTTH